MGNRRLLNFGRREFLGTFVKSAGAVLGAAGRAQAARNEKAGVGPGGKRPNLVFVFADQWRGQAFGYTGDPNAGTPNIDKLAGDSLNFTHAISGCPVCTPYRGSLMTGQYWLTHGAFMNDVYLRPGCTSIAEAFKAAGYDTAYIGKWHLDGHGRTSFTPPERRQGFDFWKAVECTHAYNNSVYYADDDEKLAWDGYDAFAQTREAQRYIREHKDGKPFALVLSWGPPHAPYHTAPEKYRAMHRPEKVQLRPNVPEEDEQIARKQLAGYYAHGNALDACIGDLRRTLEDCGIADDTVFVFTADHGDMLHSHGRQKKQQPQDESIRVPLLIRYPDKLGHAGRNLDTLINTPDLMPTLLGLCGVPIPDTVEGTDFSEALSDGQEPEVDAALIMCPAPFGQWTRDRGGREYRGLRTKRYTYTRSLDGPWLLYDNEKDPYQLQNFCGDPDYAGIQAELDALLDKKLARTNDEFRPARYYIVDERGTVPYHP